MRIVKEMCGTSTTMFNKLDMHLFGEKSMDKSCFLAEECQNGFKAMNPLISNDNVVYLALEDVLQDNTIMGCIAVQNGPFFCPFNNPGLPRYKIHTLCVNSNTRGQGVGTCLVQHVIDSIPDTGVIYLTICSPSHNKTANESATAELAMRYDRLRRLYEMLGFESIQNHDGYHWMKLPPYSVKSPTKTQL